MATGSKPSELLWRVQVEAQHPNGPSPGLESQPGASRSFNFPEPPKRVPKRGPTVAKSGLQPAHTNSLVFPFLPECVATQRLWWNEQRRQHPPIQQPRLLQPWGWWRRPFLWRTPAITYNPDCKQQFL